MTGEDQSFRQFMRNIGFGLWSGKGVVAKQDLVPTLNRVTGSNNLGLFPSILFSISDLTILTSPQAWCQGVTYMSCPQVSVRFTCLQKDGFSNPPPRNSAPLKM